MGMVTLLDDNAPDPGFAKFSSKENSKAWNLFFKLGSYADNGSSVAIPAAWLDFFTCKLLTPVDFEWVKSLLHSKVWALILRILIWIQGICHPKAFPSL
jgi:hypothetical protein